MTFTINEFELEPEFEFEFELALPIELELELELELECLCLLLEDDRFNRVCGLLLRGFSTSLDSFDFCDDFFESELELEDFEREGDKL